MNNETPEPPADRNARYQPPEAKRKAARKWFAQAKKLVDQRNYEYAIKSFVEGLYLDPEAVEEGYRPLRGCAVAKWQTGGKKPSMMDTVKHSMTTKDSLKGLVNAAWLMAHDPNSLAYAEGVMKNANKIRCEDALFWIGPIFREILGNEKKPQPKKFTLLKEIYEELGDRCQARGELGPAAKAYELGIEALTAQKRVEPDNRALDNIIRDLSTKLTILKGQYQSAESFRESMVDSEEQAKIHDVDRLVLSADRHEELITKARADMEANPGVEAKIIAYVDLLAKDETDEHEKQAIAMLLDRYKETNNFRFKQRADDIAIRQMGRHARMARKNGDVDGFKDIQRRRLAFEVKTFKERVDKYPTDLRLKHEYGKRLFMVRRFDDAIPLFQQARSDPKVRHSCALHLGRCFFESELHSQAAGVLRDALAAYELSDDEVAKELNYWLARALEAEGKTAEAKEVYGNLVQIDYNYRDVRDRMRDLG